MPYPVQHIAATSNAAITSLARVNFINFQGRKDETNLTQAGFSKKTPQIIGGGHGYFSDTCRILGESHTPKFPDTQNPGLDSVCKKTIYTTANRQRGLSEAGLPHDHFMAKVSKVLGQGVSQKFGTPATDYAVAQVDEVHGRAEATVGRNLHEHQHRLVESVDYFRAGGDEIRRHINPGHSNSASEDMPTCPEFQHSPGSQGSKIPHFERWNIRILGGNLGPDACATAQCFGKVGSEIAPLLGSATAQNERSALLSEDQALRGIITLPPLAEVSADVLGEGVCEKLRIPYATPQNGQAYSVSAQAKVPKVLGQGASQKFGIPRTNPQNGRANQICTLATPGMVRLPETTRYLAAMMESAEVGKSHFVRARRMGARGVSA